MSTGCEFHAEAVAELAAGRLDPARAGRVREHLAGCRACRDDFEVLSRVASAPAVPPAGLEARIQAAVREAAAGGVVSPARGMSRRWSTWALPLAAAAALATVWVVGADRSAQPPEPEGVVLGADVEEPYGSWPAAGPEVAGEPVLSELSDDNLELLLEEMQP